MKKTDAAKERNQLGAHLRSLRRAARPAVSQEDLAGRLAGMGIQLDRSAISRIENQERYLMDYELLGILKALRVKSVDFFQEIGK